ncbi:hypothetical protein E2C01_024718 [Portunus trituberculatus]|uniref:Uncharacterized protein n=1 Tax=Portunus trituberculatus TaxID=210409 RepID=A0A5B7EDL7_PORTR|nr:hypothetical protein [Portunus trituberculatus]
MLKRKSRKLEKSLTLRGFSESKGSVCWSWHSGDVTNSPSAFGDTSGLPTLAVDSETIKEAQVKTHRYVSDLVSETYGGSRCARHEVQYKTIESVNPRTDAAERRQRWSAGVRTL